MDWILTIRFLWRMNPRRLEAEAIRDSVLSVSGVLNDEPVLGSVIASEPSGPIDRIKQKLTKRSGKVQTNDPMYRSVYLSLPRNDLPEILDLFDIPDATAVQGKRDSTNVPSQSLFLLNSDWIGRRSKELAKRVFDKYPGKANERFQERIEYAYRLALSRNPTAKEVHLAKTMIEQIGPRKKWVGHPLQEHYSQPLNFAM